jgi:hypothetical protein
MKPKLEFDPDFAFSAGCNRFRKPLIRGRVLVLAAGGLIAYGLIPANRVCTRLEPHRWPGAPNRMMIQPQVRLLPAQVRALPLDDRFVIAAQREIDPEMVYPAPIQLDEAMVIRERGR